MYCEDWHPILGVPKPRALCYLGQASMGACKILNYSPFIAGMEPFFEQQ